jgi:hypothetical protein
MPLRAQTLYGLERDTAQERDHDSERLMWHSDSEPAPQPRVTRQSRSGYQPDALVEYCDSQQAPRLLRLSERKHAR